MVHRNRILLLLCTMILVPVGVMGQERAGSDPAPQKSKAPDPQSWQRYTVKGEGFSVTLPTVPSMITNKAFQPRLQKTRRERQLTTYVDGVLYIIDVFENPKPRQSLDEFITEQNSRSIYDLTTERNLTNNGIAGKEYSLRDQSRPATVQFFAREDRLYRFTATGAGAENAAVKQFLSSIMLGKKTDGIKVSDGPGLPLDFQAQKIYTGKEVDAKARLVSKPEPSYTEKARQEGIVGTVVLKVVFAWNGQITNIRVASGLPFGLTEQAVKSAKKIKFIPAKKDGQYVSMWMQLEYNFNLF